MEFPFLVSGLGRTAVADESERIRDLIEQVLFTSPGERVNRPDFGSGIRQLVFAPNSAELAATTQFLVQGALQKWLGDVIEVRAVEAASEDSKLEVTIEYLVRRTQREEVARFTREI